MNIVDAKIACFQGFSVIAQVAISRQVHRYKPGMRDPNAARERRGVARALLGIT